MAGGIKVWKADEVELEVGGMGRRDTVELESELVVDILFIDFCALGSARPAGCEPHYFSPRLTASVNKPTLRLLL